MASIYDPRVLSHDPEAGITEYFYSDPDKEDGFVIETRQDYTALAELNYELRKDEPGKWGEMARVASYPMTLWHELKKKGILDDQGEYRKWLNDPDNRIFRTRTGRV